MTRTCPDCGAGIVRPRALRCDPCRESRRAAQSRARQARYAAQRDANLTARQRAWKRFNRATRRRRRYRELNPHDMCIDCGEELEGRNDNKRCPPCRLIWRRQLANARQAAYRKRRKEARS